MKSGVWAKAALFNDQGQILLIRRSKTDKGRPGEWDFPGGNIEPNEDIIVGVVREIQEEAGLQVAAPKLKLVYGATQVYPELSVTKLLFVGRTSADNVALSFEHDKYQWVDIETALKEFPHPFYGVGLKYARDHNLLGIN